jgi:hypothetical protein
MRKLLIALGLAVLMCCFFSPVLANAAPCQCNGSAIIEISGFQLPEASFMVDGNLLTCNIMDGVDPLTVSIYWCQCITTAQGNKTCATPHEEYTWDPLRPFPLPGEYHYGDELHGCVWANIDGHYVCCNTGCW